MLANQIIDSQVAEFFELLSEIVESEIIEWIVEICIILPAKICSFLEIAKHLAISGYFRKWLMIF